MEGKAVILCGAVKGGRNFYKQREISELGRTEHVGKGGEGIRRWMGNWMEQGKGGT